MAEKNVSSLSDKELRIELKSFDQNVGPITKTTRKTLERKLLKLRSDFKPSVAISQDVIPGLKTAVTRRKSAGGAVSAKRKNTSKTLAPFSSDEEEKIPQNAVEVSLVDQRRGKSRRRTMPANVVINKIDSQENHYAEKPNVVKAATALKNDSIKFTAVRNKDSHHISRNHQTSEFSDEDIFVENNIRPLSSKSQSKPNNVNLFRSSTPSRDNLNRTTHQSRHSYSTGLSTRQSSNQNNVTASNIRNEIDASLIQIRNSFTAKKPSPPRTSAVKEISPKKVLEIDYDEEEEEEEDDDDEEISDDEFVSNSKSRFSSILKSLASILLVLLIIYMGLYFSYESRYQQLPAISYKKGEQNENFSIKTTDIGKYLNCLYEKLSRTAGDVDCGYLHEKQINISLLKDYSSPCFVPNVNSDKLIDASLKYAGKELQSFIVIGNGTVSSTVSSRSLFCRTQQALSLIFFRVAILIAALLVGIGLYFYIKRRWTSDDEEARMVMYFVDKIIDTLKRHHLVCMNNKEIPPFLPIPHVRDMLIPVAKRKNMSKTWQRAVDFLNSSESRIRVETQRIAGEDFDVWRWIGICTPKVKSDKKSSYSNKNAHLVSEQSKCWQGPAFDDIEKVVRMPIVTPTPCLKIRYMHEGAEEKDKDWQTQTEDAILEKCGKDGAQILHISVDEMSKEGCVYVKCDSLDSAGKAFRSIYGNWFDGRLAIVKFVTLARYHQRFPDALNCVDILQPSGRFPSSMSWVKENHMTS